MKTILLTFYLTFIFLLFSQIKSLKRPTIVHHNANYDFKLTKPENITAEYYYGLFNCSLSAEDKKKDEVFQFVKGQ